MTDYTKLVKALRCCVKARNCEKCGYRINNNSVKCRIQRVEDAAAAIEELDAEETRLLLLTSELQEKLMDAQAEVKRLELDNEDYEYTLRERYDEPKQRKLGRWEKAKPKGVVVYSDVYAECSSCHEVILLGWGMNFCPHYGSKVNVGGAGMRFAEGFFRFCNAMYLGMMLERSFYSELSAVDIVLTTLNVVTLIAWIAADICRTKREVQE